MNMKTDFQNLATKLISQTFGSIAQSVIIRRPVFNNYDEESGTLISFHDDHIVNGIVGPWKNDNQAAQSGDKIRSDDLSLMFAKQDITIEPALNYDIAILPDKSEWAIVYYEKDEAEATITCRLSKGTEE